MHDRDAGRGGRLIVAALVAVMLTACGAGDGDDAGGDSAVAEDAGADLDVCGLLSDEEVVEFLGRQLTGDPSGESIYPSCTWGIGRLIVQVDTEGRELIVAPGVECSPVDVGNEGILCPGVVQFLTDDNRVRVSTIENVEPEGLVDVAEVLAPRL